MIAPVSVIIPCYCCAKTIERAACSVAKQSIRPQELILINDASTDNTINVLNNLKDKYGSWVKIIDLQINVGAASARNQGWAIATQPYIAFLDSDDAWHSKKIEIQYRYMRDNPKITLSGHNFCDLSLNATAKLDWNVGAEEIKHVTYGCMLIKNQFVTPSVMLKRDIPFRFFEGRRHAEDHLLWLQIMSSELLAVKLNTKLAAVYKPMFGASGLSSNMWSMEKAELLNYKYLYHHEKLRFYQYLFLQQFSVLKFIRRLIVVYIVRYIWRT